MSVVTPLFNDDGDSHEIVRLRRDNLSLKRMLQAAHEEIETANEIVKKFHQENKRLKIQLTRQDREEAEDELVTAVFDFWNHMCGHSRSKLGPKRTKKIQERLRDRPPTLPVEFFRAILGAAFDPFVKDDKVFNDLELICRDESKLDAFIQRYYLIPDVAVFVRDTGGEKAKAAATVLMDLHRRQQVVDKRSIDRKGTTEQGETRE